MNQTEQYAQQLLEDIHSLYSNYQNAEFPLAARSQLQKEYQAKWAEYESLTGQSPFQGAQATDYYNQQQPAGKIIRGIEPR